jgi:hypothetical protein
MEGRTPETAPHRKQLERRLGPQLFMEGEERRAPSRPEHLLHGPWLARLRHDRWRPGRAFDRARAASRTVSRYGD